MCAHHKFFAALIFISLLTLSTYAQDAGPEVRHFEAEGISFDYPAGYSVSDASTPDEQRFILTQKGSSVQITIVSQRGFIRRSELSRALAGFTEPFVKNVALKIGKGTNTPARTPIQTQVGSGEAEGVRLRFSGTTKSADVIWLRMNFRLIGLALVRSDSDETVASQLWQAIRSSLRAVGPVIAFGRTEAEPSEASVDEGVLNGEALALPQPTYPSIARNARASGTVTVQVVIDEQGKVSSARAVSGHPLLQAVSVAAARQARFTPTLLDGEPVKVTGVITYNFVRQ